MPYILVDEIPEGATEADVVSREEYDEAVRERDEYSAQRDEAISQIAEHDKGRRAAEAKYADLILNMGSGTQQKKQEPTPTRAKPITTESLFKED